MKKWGIILLLLLIVLFGSAAFIVYQKGFPTEWARLKIISSLEERMNIKAKVDNVAFGFPNRIIVNGLSISQLQTGTTTNPAHAARKSSLAHTHPIVKAKQIVIQCHLQDIILKRHPSSYGIDKAVISSAELYLSRSKDGVWNTASIFKQGKRKSHSPPEFSLFTKNSLIIFHDELSDIAASTVLSKIRASYVNGRFKAKALLGDIQSESLTPLHCSGVIHAVSPIDMNWDIDVKKTNLSRYSPYLKLPFGQVLDGDAWVNLKGRASCTSFPQKGKAIMIGGYTIYGLSGQVGVQDGRFLLKNARLPFNQVNGVFRLTSDSRGTGTAGDGSKLAVLEHKAAAKMALFARVAHAAGSSTGSSTKQVPAILPVTTLTADGLRAVLCGAEIKTTLAVPDINNPETLLAVETSVFDASILKYLTKIDRLRNYFSKSKLKTSLKFNGKIIPHPFTISGSLKTNNLLGKKRFLAKAGFVFNDNGFESIDVDIDKKTSI
ncbi:MAG: hypothetical protein AAB110_04865, partial [Candidatus Desantisbacteria bacterium]